MKISITQISNGWMITITPPNSTVQSSLYVSTFPDVVKQLQDMYNIGEQQSKEIVKTETSTTT